MKNILYDSNNYKMIQYENLDVLIYYSESVVGYGKFTEDEIYQLFSDGQLYYPGSKNFNSIEEILNCFENCRLERLKRDKVSQKVVSNDNEDPMFMHTFFRGLD